MILYALLKFLTFPGAFLKGFWEHVICKLLGLPVESSNYLSANELCGHVDHALPKTPLKAFFLAICPSAINLFTGSVFLSTGYKFIFEMGIRYYESKLAFILGVAMLYIGISFLCNIFPFVEDAMNLYDILYAQKKGNIIGRILAFIPTAIIYAGAYLEKYCITTVLWIVLTVVAAFMNKYSLMPM